MATAERKTAHALAALVAFFLLSSISGALGQDAGATSAAPTTVSTSSGETSGCDSVIQLDAARGGWLFTDAKLGERCLSPPSQNAPVASDMWQRVCSDDCRLGITQSVQAAGCKTPQILSILPFLNSAVCVKSANSSNYCAVDVLGDAQTVSSQFTDAVFCRDCYGEMVIGASRVSNLPKSNVTNQIVLSYRQDLIYIILPPLGQVSDALNKTCGTDYGVGKAAGPFPTTQSPTSVPTTSNNTSSDPGSKSSARSYFPNAHWWHLFIIAVSLIVL